MDNGEPFQRYGGAEVFPYPQNIRMGSAQDFMSDFTSLAPAPSVNITASHVGSTMNPVGNSFDSSSLPNTLEPTAEDLEHYRMFTLFRTHVGSR